MKEMAPKTLVLGGGGFLGRYFSRILGDTAVVHTRINSNEPGNTVALDIQNERDMVGLLSEFEIDTVINCLALANIEECERNPDLANWVNAEIPSIIAKYSSVRSIQNVFISTDAVLEPNSFLRNEEASTAGGSVYSRTKLNGEKASVANNPESLVARVNFFGSSPKKNSLFEYFYTNLRAGKPVVGYENIIFTTMYAKYTVLSILGLVEKNSVGIFHVVGNERLSKYSFGQILAGELGLGELVVSQKADQNFLTVRSEELSLDNSKLKAAIGQVPTIYESIREALAEIESGVESGAE